MHILLLPSWYPTEENPVKGSFFLEQAEALAAIGHTVSVIAMFRRGKKKTCWEISRRGNLTEYRLYYDTLPLHLTFFRLMGEIAGLFRREFRGRMPDITHVHVYQLLPYAMAIRRIYGIPYVVTEHVTWFERGIVSKKALRRAEAGFRQADAVITVSPGLRETIRPLCGDREIDVVPNLVSPRFFEGELRAPRGERFDFISIGTLEHKKGMDALLRAFERVCRRVPDAVLTVCGDGPDAEALSRQARELGIGDKVTFTGQVSREEVARRLRQSQCFVLPSRSETFGVVFIEAMACGLPIVMTKTSAWELLVLPETGLAVDIDDESGLADAMCSVAENYDAYDPERIRQSCIDRFSDRAVAERLTEIYRGVLRRRGKAGL